jgi:uncharacterized protein with FMN-binding domain
MTEVGFLRRVAPAVLLAVAGGTLLYLLPSGGDGDTSSTEDFDLAQSAGASVAASSSATTPAASGAPAGSGKRVLKGDPVDFRYGTVQVKVLLDGTTLANIATLTAPGGSYQPYTDRAIPGMKAKILKAQSTHVAAVSGATYTSNAYAQSIQSALDKA